MLEGRRARTNALNLYRITRYRLEPQPYRLLWFFSYHHTLHGQPYYQYVVQLEPRYELTLGTSGTFALLYVRKREYRWTGCIAETGGSPLCNSYAPIYNTTDTNCCCCCCWSVLKGLRLAFGVFSTMRVLSRTDARLNTYQCYECPWYIVIRTYWCTGAYTIKKSTRYKKMRFDFLELEQHEMSTSSTISCSAFRCTMHDAGCPRDVNTYVPGTNLVIYLYFDHYTQQHCARIHG